MDIEEQKNKFLELLHNSYQAQEAMPTGEFLMNYLSEPRGEKDVFVKEKTLKQYGLDNDEFWEIVCPCLKKEGWLESFKNPNIVSAEDKDTYVNGFPECAELIREINELNNALPPMYRFSKSIWEAHLKNDTLTRTEHQKDFEKAVAMDLQLKIDEAEKRLMKFIRFIQSNYPHKFVITDKLINSTNKTEGRLTFDELNGVLEYSNNKLSFQKGRTGEKPRLLFIRKLWLERKYIRKGVEKKKGMAFPISALAKLINVSEDQVKSMVKNINRQLIKKRLPAKIERKNGILLVVIEK